MKSRLLSLKLSLLSVALISFVSTPAFADQWSLSGDQEHAPNQPENRIIKWCEDEGQSERWASANIQLKGYTPCGKLSALATCDAGGTRMIGGEADGRPRGHRDCSIGPRILIVNHGEADTMDTSSMAESPEDVTPLTTKEADELKKEFEHAKRVQDKDPAMQMQKLADMLLSQMLTGSPNGTTKGRNRRKSEQNLDKMLQNVDPKTKKALKQLLKQYGP